MKKRIFYKTRLKKPPLETILEDPEIEEENSTKKDECESAINKITPDNLEIARSIDDFEKNKDKKDNPKNTIKRSKTFISGLSSLENGDLHHFHK